MTLKEGIEMKHGKRLTPGRQVRQFYQGCRLTQRLSAAGLDDHLIVATSGLDFLAKYYAHENGRHKYCLPIPNAAQLHGETEE